MSGLTLKFNLSIDTSELEDKKAELIEDMKEAITLAMRANIDKGARYSWVESGGPLSPGSSASRGLISEPSSAPQIAESSLQNMYASMWQERYEALQSAFEAANKGGPLFVDSYEEYLEWKSEQSGQAPWAGQEFGHYYETDHAIMTGTLLDKPMNVFEGFNNNEYFEMDNPMLRGAWRHNLDQYEHSGFNHVLEISKSYAGKHDETNYNIYSEVDDMTDFTKSIVGTGPDKLRSIAQRMRRLLRKNFKEDLVNKLEDINIG